MNRTFVSLGALWGALAILAGAFGAHALRSRLDAHLLSVFETAARYHMYQALALIGLGLSLALGRPTAWFTIAGWLLFGGSVVFSGSLYLLALTGVRMLGAITPIGGLAAIGGWLAWAYAVWSTRR